MKPSISSLAPLPWPRDVEFADDAALARFRHPQRSALARAIAAHTGPWSSADVERLGLVHGLTLQVCGSTLRISSASYQA